MRRLFLFIFTFFFSSISYSQDSMDLNYPMGTFGASGSINSVILKPHPGYNHAYSNDQIGINTGIDFGVRLSKRIELSGGLYYFGFGYSVDYDWIFLQPNDPSIPRSSKAELIYYEFPVTFSYHILANKKIAMYSNIGFTFSRLNSSEGSIIYQDYSTSELYFQNSNIFSSQIGLGLQLNLSDDTWLKFEPQYRMFTNGFDEIMHQKPYSFLFFVRIASRFDWKCVFRGDAWKPLPRCD